MGGNPFGGMGGAPNMQGMQQMMNNPEVMSMMTNMLSNPEMARLVINSNPQLQNMGVTPEMLSGMVSNPLFQSLMSNPELARNMAQFGGMGNPFGGAPGANPTDNQNAGSAENRSNNLAQLLSQMPQLGSAPVQPVSNPEERYQNELAQLREMGFTDPAKNVRALLASGGDVNLAIEYLFNQP
jgi:ubiquilin